MQLAVFDPRLYIRAHRIDEPLSAGSLVTEARLPSHQQNLSSGTVVLVEGVSPPGNAAVFNITPIVRDRLVATHPQSGKSSP